MNCGKCTAKTLMGLLGFLFFVFGLVCIAFGSYVVHNRDELEIDADFGNIQTPSVILIIVGFVFFGAGINGCYNVKKDNKCCLFSFFICLLLVFILITTVAVGGVIVFDRIINHSESAYNATMQGYHFNNTKAKNDMIDNFQTNYECCGLLSREDWNNTPFGKPPDSCKSFNVGCYPIFKNLIKTLHRYTIGVAFGILVILLLGMFGACFLICKKKGFMGYTEM